MSNDRHFISVIFSPCLKHSICELDCLCFGSFIGSNIEESGCGLWMLFAFLRYGIH